MRAAQTRPKDHAVTRGSLNDSEEVRQERYRKLAALIREWENTDHGKEFWPVLEAELNRNDD